MNVANRHRQRISRVGLHRTAQTEQHVDHFLHLFFGRLAIANHGDLYLRGRVLGKAYLILRRRQQSHAACLTELESALHVT